MEISRQQLPGSYGCSDHIMSLGWFIEIRSFCLPGLDVQLSSYDRSFGLIIRPYNRKE